MEQPTVDKPKQNNIAKFISDNSVSQSKPLTTASDYTSRHVGAGKSRKKPNQTAVTTAMYTNYSSHHFTGPHYSRLQAASSSASYQRNNRHYNYHKSSEILVNHTCDCM